MSQPQSSNAGSSPGPKLSFFQRLFYWGSNYTGPAWDPKFKRFQTQWLYRFVLVLVLAGTAVVVYWVILQDVTAAPVKALPAGVGLATILAPVLAAATGVERTMETLFSVIESNWRTLIAYLGRGCAANTETEVENSRNTDQVTAQYNRSSSPATVRRAAPSSMPALPGGRWKSSAQKLMKLAEQRVKIAEEQLSQITSSDHYRNAKRAASIYLGLLLGLIVATAGSMQMFAMMGISVGNPKIDVIVTGVVIGSGSGPVHSLICILAAAKETLNSAQGWLERLQKKPLSTEQGE
jgi:hypothetical protein